MSHTRPEEPVTYEVFGDPIVQLAAICPICALAALSPVAALAALAPTLRVFNPAINPNAAMLAFVAPQLAIHAHVKARILTALLRRRTT